MKRSQKYLTPALKEKLANFYSAKSLAMMASIFGVQLGAHAFGVGWVGDVLAVAVLVVALGRDVIEVGSDMRDFVMGAANAKSEEDLELAAQHLADALTTAAVDVGIIAAGTAARAAGRKAGQWLRPRLGKLRDKAPGLPPLRLAYIREVEALQQVVSRMRAAGKTSEEIARTVHQMRREIGVKYKDLTPPDMLERTYERNLQKYGDKLGPTIEYLGGRGMSWEEIIESACRTGGEDLGLGLKQAYPPRSFAEIS